MRQQCGFEEESSVPLAFESFSRDIISSFGGASVTGVFGSNLPAMLGEVGRRYGNSFFLEFQSKRNGYEAL